ncbi:MbtH family protein [Amycolatopsis sp. NPDC003731]
MTYRVVVNDEEQYSIWPADREGPPGWTATGFTGTKEECLSHIDEVWTDMRPASLRRAMSTSDGPVTGQRVAKHPG